MELLKGLDGLDENLPDWLSFQKLRAIIDHYSGLQINKTMLEMECIKIKSSSVPPPPHSIPNICKLLELKRTIAPTSAEAERSFSTMNCVKTPQRSRLNDERTSDLTLLSHEKELVKAIDIADIIDKFAESNRIVVVELNSPSVNYVLIVI